MTPEKAALFAANVHAGRVRRTIEELKGTRYSGEVTSDCASTFEAVEALIADGTFDLVERETRVLKNRKTGTTREVAVIHYTPIRI